jgi:hypothetical protein
MRETIEFPPVTAGDGLGARLQYANHLADLRRIRGRR